MQKLLLKKKAGFTLIELMIVVAIIGILAAIALPAFLGYVKRSKTSEATSNLKSLFTGATNYYSQERTGQGIMSLTAGSCGVTMTGPLPAAIGPDKQTFDFTLDSSFEDLGFAISDPFYFQYTIASDGAGCAAVGAAGGRMGGTSVYSFQAMGDLDGDGMASLFELAVGVNTSNELYRAAGFYVVDELE